MPTVRLAAALAAALTALPSVAAAQERPTREGFMFGYVDRDQDGRLSPGEFGLVLHPSATMGSTPKALYGSDVDAFSAADADGNGYLDRSEFSDWLRQRR